METLKHRSPESRENPEHRIELQLDGKNIGFAYMAYYARPLPLYFIEQLDIDTAYRGQGYGSRIMEFIEGHIKKRGAAGLLFDGIQPDKPAAGMYERRGWVRVGPENTRGAHAYAFNLPADFDPARLEMALQQVRR